MKISHLGVIALLAAWATLTTSCFKEKKDIDYQLLSEELSLSENLSSDAFQVVDNESRNGEYSATVGKTGVYSWTSSMDTCATVTLNTNGGNFPMTLTVDFGQGCTAYGRTREGIVQGVFTGPYTTTGSQVTVTFNNYYVDGYKIEGTKTITNSGRNGSGNLEFSVQDVNGVITKPNGAQFTWESTRVHEWTEGEGTWLWLDDVYSVSGNASGEASDGTPYSFRNQSGDPLIKAVVCPYVSDGTVIYNVDGDDIAEIDYGTSYISEGFCDATITVTFQGKDYVITVQ